jgi:hypothetical protein
MAVLAFSTFHTRTVPSNELDARCSPSYEKASDTSEFAWLLSRPCRFPVSVFQMYTVELLGPAASRFPSGEKAIQLGNDQWPTCSHCSIPVSASQIRTIDLVEVHVSHRPSGEKGMFGEKKTDDIANDSEKSLQAGSGAISDGIVLSSEICAI